MRRIGLKIKGRAAEISDYPILVLCEIVIKLLLRLKSADLQIDEK